VLTLQGALLRAVPLCHSSRHQLITNERSRSAEPWEEPAGATPGGSGGADVPRSQLRVSRVQDQLVCGATSRLLPPLHSTVGFQHLLYTAVGDMSRNKPRMLQQWAIGTVTLKSPVRCPQFYARGLFGTPPVTWIGGPYGGWLGAAKRTAFAPLALLSAGLDQPIRTLSGGKRSACSGVISDCLRCDFCCSALVSEALHPPGTAARCWCACQPGDGQVARASSTAQQSLELMGVSVQLGVSSNRLSIPWLHLGRALPMRMPEQLPAVEGIIHLCLFSPEMQAGWGRRPGRCRRQPPATTGELNMQLGGHCATRIRLQPAYEACACISMCHAVAAATMEPGFPAS
jgi:hypothetical protein